MKTTRIYEYVFANGHIHSFLVERGALTADLLWKEADELAEVHGWGEVTAVTHRSICLTQVVRPGPKYEMRVPSNYSTKLARQEEPL